MKSGKNIIALFSIITLSCSTTATITTKNGKEVESKISHSDEINIYLETYEAEVPVPRTSIIEIDHPGNVVAFFGLLFCINGALNLKEANTYGPGENKKYWQRSGGIFLGSGIIMFFWGISVWSSSTNAANSNEQNYNTKNTFITPQISFINNSPSYGASMICRF